MSIRMLNHPGVEVTEIDMSGNPAVTTGSNTLICGYSDKGEPFSPIQLAGLADYEINFGTPTNEAERYSYYGVKEVLKKGGSCLFSKLPYNNLKDTHYKYVGIKFKAGTDDIGVGSDADILSLGTAEAIQAGIQAGGYDAPDSISGDITTDLSGVIKDCYNFKKVQEVSITSTRNLHQKEFDKIKVGGWSDDIADEFILINDTKENISEYNEGLFVALVDVIDGMKVQQMFPLFESITGDINVHPFASLNTTSDDYISVINGFEGYGAPENEMAAILTAPLKDSSISEQLSMLIPTIDFVDNGNSIAKDYSNQMGIVVCKLFANESKEGKLDVSILEYYFGSFYEDARDRSTGQSIYLPNLINGSSSYISMYKNQKNCDLPEADLDTVFIAKTDQAPLIGFTTEESIKKINGDRIGHDLVKTFEKVSNVHEYQIDIVSDCGLTTIAEFCNEGYDLNNDDIISQDRVRLYNKDYGTGNTNDLSGLTYIDDDGKTQTADEFSWFTGELDVNDAKKFGYKYAYENGTLFTPENDLEEYLNGTKDRSAEMWRAVSTEIINFCQYIRKDCMCVLDVPRTLVLHGKEKHVRKTKPDNTFTNTIGKKLRYLSGLNSSYAALYANWFKMVDIFTGVNFWIPPSIKVAGLYTETDVKHKMWDAPAGLTRGILNGINDLSFNPNGKEADALYIKSFNYAQKYPLDGFILEGQKTTQTKSSAFDRVNVRRLFLRMERFVFQTARQFVYEPNNYFLRRRVIDVLTPYFNKIKARGGLYDFLIICDESNNTPEVIDANELKVMILCKPVRTAEFVRVEFVATRTNATFSNVVAELL